MWPAAERQSLGLRCYSSAATSKRMSACDPSSCEIADASDQSRPKLGTRLPLPTTLNGYERTPGARPTPRRFHEDCYRFAATDQSTDDESLE
jgi:hypothetical protein